jgi:hypothetical protein
VNPLVGQPDLVLHAGRAITVMLNIIAHNVKFMIFDLEYKPVLRFSERDDVFIF